MWGSPGCPLHFKVSWLETLIPLCHIAWHFGRFWELGCEHFLSEGGGMGQYHSVCHISIACPVTVWRGLLYLQTSHLYSRGKGWSRFPGLHQQGLSLFIRKAKCFPEVSQQILLTSHGSEVGHWLSLAAREAGKVHSREKVGIRDCGKHTHKVCHSPLLRP